MPEAVELYVDMAQVLHRGPMDVRMAVDTIQNERDLVSLGFRSLPVAGVSCCDGFTYLTELVPKIFDARPCPGRQPPAASPPGRT